MPVRRHFIDWRLPIVPGICAHLLDPVPPETPGGGGRAYDLSDTLIVAPTRQAARHLSEGLVRLAAERGAALMGARLVTSAYFLQPDPPDPRVASATLVAACWCRVLMDLRPDEAVALFPPAARGRDFDWAAHNGRMIQRLRHTLADGGRCLADVGQAAGDTLEDAQRWTDLGRLEDRYLAMLESLGWHDPLRARIAHAHEGTLPDEVRRIVVAGFTDPSLLLIASLRRAAESREVAILIHAPKALAETFDAWGRPLPERWRDRDIPIAASDGHLRLEADPGAQAERTLACYAASPSPPAIGVPDPNVTPFLATTFARAGHRVFDPSDRPLAHHPLALLVMGLTDLAQQDSYAALAALLRQADLLAAFTGDTPTRTPNQPGTPRQLLEELDRFQNTFLPETLTDLRAALDRPLPPRTDDTPALRFALDRLAPHLEGCRRGREPLAALRQFLQDVYRHRRLDPRVPEDLEFELAATELDGALRELEDAPVAALPHASSERFELLRLRLAEAQYAPVPREADCDLLGWMELPWSEAPEVIVTGLNEGSVPDTQWRDPFLPDPLRVKLGLRHDASRLARDAHLLSSLIACRAESGRVTLIVGKTGLGGDPLRPSRLLFRCPPEALADRAALLFGPVEAARPSMPATIGFTLNSAPPPDVKSSALSITRLSVTALRGYLACPFRFYLQQVLGMERLEDRAIGLDAAAFGTLIHAALETMAAEAWWGCPDAPRLAGMLQAEADRWIRERFGSRPPVVVSLALDAARQRLAALARLQTALVAEGWEPIHSELKFTGILAGLQLVGKIDRIDRHRRTGAVRIIDYKTSDQPTPPAQAHLGSARADTPEWQILAGDRPRRWLDLQLPLYVWLLRNGASSHPLEIDPHAPLEPCYCNLPKAVDSTALTPWSDLGDVLVADAARCAEAAAARIVAREFWPPAERVRYDDFEGLLLGDPQRTARPPFPETAP